MATPELICETLKAQGRRLTPQRRAIIQALLDDDSHPTVEQILSRVRRILPDISPATIYNTLDELVELGVVRELDVGLGERHYDIRTADHAHLVCIRCHRVEDVPFNYDALGTDAQHLRGFAVLERQLILRGYCPECLASQ
ncbi:MAG: transcriptional repressor [Anaerolineae bacterium]|nr:transcriptional repressor [Anaerolineae bacterium]